jgi:GTPase SAR1 family protein
MLQIGVEYGLKPAQVKGRDIQIEIWDTAGQECYMALTRS